MEWRHFVTYLWNDPRKKGRDGQKKKIGKANERKEKVKREKDEEVNGQGK